MVSSSRKDSSRNFLSIYPHPKIKTSQSQRWKHLPITPSINRPISPSNLHRHIRFGSKFTPASFWWKLLVHRSFRQLPNHAKIGIPTSPNSPRKIIHLPTKFTVCTLGRIHFTLFPLDRNPHRAHYSFIYVFRPLPRPVTKIHRRDFNDGRQKPHAARKMKTSLAPPPRLSPWLGEHHRHHHQHHLSVLQEK